jgi:hypothetical protein
VVANWPRQRRKAGRWKFENIKFKIRKGKVFTSAYVSEEQILTFVFFIMARRRKNRTHLKGDVAKDVNVASGPKSFIIKHGPVGSSVSQLVRDMRKVMEPNTASRLKVYFFLLICGLYLS